MHDFRQHNNAGENEPPDQWCLGGFLCFSCMIAIAHVGFLSMEFKRHSEVEPLMNVDEVCAALGCKKSKLYELMGSGRLESVKLGGSRLFRPDAVRECVQRHVDRRYRKGR
jgi:excisionase family DNA binding protein